MAKEIIDSVEKLEEELEYLKTEGRADIACKSS